MTRTHRGLAGALLLGITLGCNAATPPLGAVVPTAVNWMPADGGGFSGVIQFTNDPRNVCGAQGLFDDVAVLRLHMDPTDAYRDGLTFAWVTDLVDRMGAAPPRHAYFSMDTLSTLNLKDASGTVELVRAPVTGGATNAVVTLRSEDGGVDATFTATPLCP